MRNTSILAPSAAVRKSGFFAKVSKCARRPTAVAIDGLRSAAVSAAIAAAFSGASGPLTPPSTAAQSVGVSGASMAEKIRIFGAARTGWASMTTIIAIKAMTIGRPLKARRTVIMSAPHGQLRSGSRRRED